MKLKFWPALILAFSLATMPGLHGQSDDSAHARLSAMALEQSGQNAEAESAWSAILSADPRNAEALAHMGLLEARQQHLETAIGYYRRAAAIDPDRPGLQMNLGLALFKAAQFPDAIQSFSSEIRKYPGDQRLMILLGMAHYGMKDYLVAIPYLEKAVERSPQDVTLRLTLAHSCMSSKQYECVVDAQKAMRASNAESAEADLLSAAAREKMGQGQEAINDLRDALRANPNDPELHFALGYLLWTQDKWADAADQFQLSLQNNPQHTKSRVYLADCLVRQNQNAKALPDLEKLSASDPSEPLVHIDLGIIDSAAGRTDDAIREFEMADDADPDSVETHRQLARLYRSAGKPEEAKAEVEKGSRISQSHRPLQEVIETQAP
ncbi:MAG TPA: tetratricopeptide repeat protein [Terracidiphilus sp.]|nr:tetratricopeptide repeat protein [Terracidiphilus sp.]